MAKTHRARKPKKVSYLLIDRQSDAGKPLYLVLQELVAAHHEDLRDARIALAWNLAWQPDVDGRCILGKCVKASDLDRELAPFDFVILLRRDFVDDPRVTPQQKRALIDHELCHAAVKYDASGEPMIDQRGRPVFRTRKHDLEEFAAIVERYGCWKKDLEAFAGAIDRARARAGNWVGYQRLRDSLAAAGVSIHLETIIQWTEEQRREADVWANIQLELTKQDLADAIEVSCPEHVKAAIAADRQGELVMATTPTAGGTH